MIESTLDKMERLAHDLQDNITDLEGCINEFEKLPIINKEGHNEVHSLKSELQATTKTRNNLLDILKAREVIK